MIDFLKKLFRNESSGATARERLRLVLLSDHLSLSPDIVASIKADLLDVLSKYVEFDESACDVSFEQREREVAMLANIPIRSMRPRPPGATPPPQPPPPAPVEDPASISAAVADAPEPETQATTSSRQRRRRRRRVKLVAAAPG
jgi:cell division topological specificity factor